MKTKSLKVLIVDDEKHCRTALERRIKEYCPQLEIVDSVNSVPAARKSFYENRPDVIFLDVEMPKENGFDFLDQIDDSGTSIIFTTAYESYALKALKKRALDYLLKPIEDKELIQAVKKIDQKSSSQDKEKSGRVAIPSNQGLLFVNLDEVIWCKAEGSYTQIATSSRSILVSKNIGAVEKLFGPDSLFRVHKSYLINLQHVKEYVRGGGGFAVMSDDKHVDVSKRKREDFLLALE